MVWQNLLDVLFPPQCAGCNAIGSGLCEACFPRETEVVTVSLSGLRVVACGTYEGALRAAVLAVKDGRRDVALALGVRIAPLIAGGATLVPVPTTKQRLRVRGLDGVVTIAESAAMHAGARVRGVLRHRAGNAQHGRNRGERLAAFNRFASEPAVFTAPVTLVDDVCTTGATLTDCARVLREAGVSVAGAVVVAATKARPLWNQRR